MSREEAAEIYLDNLLGFRSKYSQYREAADALSDDDKQLLSQAVGQRPKAGSKKATGASFFSGIN